MAKDTAQIGETRERAGGTYKKVAEGKWVRWAQGRAEGSVEKLRGAQKDTPGASRKPSEAALHSSYLANRLSAKADTPDRHFQAMKAHERAAKLTGSSDNERAARHREMIAKHSSELPAGFKSRGEGAGLKEGAPSDRKSTPAKASTTPPKKSQRDVRP